MASGTIKVYQGNSWGPYDPPFQYADGTPYTLPEGTIVLFTVKRKDDDSPNDDNALIKKDWTGSAWSLTPTDTDIAAGEYLWDLKIVNAPQGLDRNTDAGRFVVEKPLTRRTS